MRILSYRCGLPLIVAFAATVNLTLPARAQSSWSYNPFTGTSTWLTLSRSLAYPLNRLSSTSMPLYLANPLIYGAAYGGTQAITGSQRQLYYGNNQTQQQPDPNGLYADPNAPNVGRMRNRPFGYHGGVADQVTYQNRPQQPQPANQDEAILNGADSALRGEPKPAPPFPVTAPPYQPAQPTYQAPAATPRVRGWGRGKVSRNAGAAPNTVQAPATSVGNPMAQGFITLVNEKYGGDVSRALFDPEMRSYAKSIGLIDGDKLFQANLSPDRAQLIRQILNDPHEDAASRINAVRLLLKH